MENYKICMFGPSGGGKTTLAKVIPMMLGIKFISGSVHKIFSEEQIKELLRYGYICGKAGHRKVINLSSVNPEFGGKFQRYAALQRRKLILDNQNFVTDRSPIDNLTYFHLQCSHNQTEKAIEEMIELTKDTFKYLTHAIYVKSVLPEGVALEDNDSRIPNKYYQVMVDQVFEAIFNKYFLELSAVYKNKGPKVIILDYWDIEKRIDTLLHFFKKPPDMKEDILVELFNNIK